MSAGIRTIPVAWLVAALVLVSSPGYAGNPEKKVDLSIGGSAFTEEGRIEGGHFLANSYMGDLGDYKPLLSKTAVNLTLEATLKQRLRIVVQPEVQIWFNTISERWMQNLGSYRFTPYTSVLIQQGFGEYRLGDPALPWLSASIGRFLYKYNPEAANLGEYLFRSGCYPNYLVTNFDFPVARLTGLRLNSTLFRGLLRQDLFFTREEEIEPLQDYSLSYILGANLRGIVDIGVGGSLWRFLAAEDSMTTPRYPYLNSYLKSNGDTAYYSFSGTKLMGRVSFDPKQLFHARIFGKEDLKIFVEAAVLGVSDIIDYTPRDTSDSLGNTIHIPHRGGYYDSLWQRIPVMFGINVPTFKLLDVLSFQVEWWGNRFPNDYYYVTFGSNQSTVAPIPAKLANSPYRVGVYNYHRDDWKWSVYARKTVVKGFSIAGQIANDHLRHRVDKLDWKDENEVMSKSTDWYWILKAQFSF